MSVGREIVLKKSRGKILENINQSEINVCLHPKCVNDKTSTRPVVLKEILGKGTLSDPQTVFRILSLSA